MSSPSTSKSDEAQATPLQIFQSDCICVGKIQFVKRRRLVYNKKSSSVMLDTSTNADSVDALVYAIRLNRIIRDDEANAKNRDIVRKYLHLDRINDLIHSIVALYDYALPDIGIQYIYDCICARKAYTICVFKDVDWSSVDSSVNTVEVEYDEETDCLESIDNDVPKSIFHQLFHKSNSSSEESDGDDAEAGDESKDDKDTGADDDFTVGIKTFIEKYKKSNENNTSNLRNPLNRLLACATIERINTFQYPGQDEWVILLQLMAVMKPYRGYGIGKYLMNNIIQNPTLVGPYDAIITSSDSDAIEFYEKYGFNDNPILNSKYKSIGDCWTNTTKMCYIPPYMLKTAEKQKVSTELNSLDELTQLENDYKKWNKIALTSYQINSQIFNKLKQEIISLKAKQCAQDNIINDLQIRNQILERKNRLLNIQLKNSKKSSSNDNEELDVEVDSDEFKAAASSEDTEIDKLISELKQITGDSTKFGLKSEDRIVKQFKNSLKKSELKYNIEIKSVRMSKNLKKSYRDEYEAVKASLVNDDSTLISELYASKLVVPAGANQEDFYESILANGLCTSHLVASSYGVNGIYLSRYASIDKKRGFILFTEAVLSNCFTVSADIDKNLDEKALKNHESLLIISSNTENLKENEYFLFNFKHVLPIAVIEYELSEN